MMTDMSTTMDDEKNTADGSQQNWLEKLSHAFMRDPQDRSQLVSILRDAAKRQLIDADALGMIEGVMQIVEMQVRDIMIPRSQMVVVKATQQPEDFLPLISESGHSRFPVIGESKDEVIGILLAKELLKYSFNGHRKKFNIKQSLRRAVFVPESKRLDVLLKEFRVNHDHMAIVVDEYGGVAGLVTMEDILEQIVGEIEDEYDVDDELNIKKLSEAQFTVKAITPIEDFNEYFSTDMDTEEFDTIGGIVLKAFGHLPKRDETVNIGNYQFKVLHSDNRRIRLLHVTINQKNIT